MTCPGILVIEDDDDIRESIHLVLESEGYCVQSFRNGKEALESLKSCADMARSCLILLDLMMPIMNGWEFLNQKKFLDVAIHAIPVFIVSAVAEPLKQHTEVKGFVKKPVDIDILLKIVETYCGKPNQKAA